MYLSKIKNSFIILSLFLFFFSNQIFSQVDYHFLFYPLAIGDTWEYSIKDKPLGVDEESSRYTTLKIVGKDTLDSKIYFQISNSENYCLKNIRFDSTNGTVWEYKDGIDCLIDSLAIKKGERGFSNTCYGSVVRLWDTLKTILNMEKAVLTYMYSEPTTSQYRMSMQYEYAVGIGRCYSHSTYPAPDGYEAGYRTETLIYAKIDEIEYGTHVAEFIEPNIKFYPLQVGNKWQYYVHKTIGAQNERDTTYSYTNEIVGKEMIDGKLYYQVSHDGSTNYNLIRIDSTYAAVYSYNNGSECMISILNGTGFGNECYGIVQTILDTNKLVFSEQREIIGLSYSSPFTCKYSRHGKFEYASGIGKIFSHFEYPSPSEYTDGFKIDSLVYAKINGVEYGEFRSKDIAFYPLHIGDTWQYLVELKYQDSSKDSSYYASVYVRDIDTLDDGKEYYNITNSENYCLKQIRIDSTDATVWQYNQYMLDSLSMQPNDRMSVANSQDPKMCFADSIEILFDTDIRVKTFAPINIPLSQNSVADMGVKYLYKYGWGIGEIYSETSDIGIEASRIVRTLNYAKIDGVEYGDLTYSENQNIFLSESILYLFQNENNSNFADTTWLINKSSEILMVDSVINNRGYSYTFDVLFSDNSSHRYSLMQNYIDTVAFSVNPDDSIRIILSNPDLCPICDGGGIEVFTDSLQIFTNSKTNSVLLLSIIGDGTLDTENIEYGNLKFSLQQNYPNPFNPSTTIKYSIPVETLRATSEQIVTLKVYDILGREVATLVNKAQKAGNYDVNFNANVLTSGVYFYTLKAGKYRATNKMLLVK